MGARNLRIVQQQSPDGRPRPPAELLDNPTLEFRPSPELCSWAMRTFVIEGAPLLNPDHQHLRQATIGFLWASGPNRVRGRAVAGMAGLGKPMGSDAWKVGQREQQLRGFFGDVPQFLILIDALFASACDNVAFCALIEHELYHCGQAVDDLGQSRFSDTTGLPVWTVRPHDVEEFVGVVRRYGAVGLNVDELVKAANREPAMNTAAIAASCGTCAK